MRTTKGEYYHNLHHYLDDIWRPKSYKIHLQIKLVPKYGICTTIYPKFSKFSGNFKIVGSFRPCDQFHSIYRQNCTQYTSNCPCVFVKLDNNRDNTLTSNISTKCNRCFAMFIMFNVSWQSHCLIHGKSGHLRSKNS